MKQQPIQVKISRSTHVHVMRCGSHLVKKTQFDSRHGTEANPHQELNAEKADAEEWHSDATGDL